MERIGEVMKVIQLDTTSLKWIGELFMTQVSSFPGKH